MASFYLEPVDILYAAVLAYLIFTMVRWIWKKSETKTAKEKEQLYNKMLANGALNKCYELFPIEEIVFEGKTFTKGEKVNIKTFNHRILEGMLVGRDDKERLCVVTDRYVIVHEIKEIFEMHLVG